MSSASDDYDAAAAALDERRWSDAQRLFASVLASDPACVEALFGLAAAHREQHQYREARAAYERGVACEERQSALTLLGAIQNKLGDTPAAIRSLERSLVLAPDDDEAHFHLGLALRWSDPDAALRHFQRAIVIDPGPAPYHREAGLTLWRLERFDEALTAVHRAVASAPDDSFAHHYLGLIHESLGDLAASKAAHLSAATVEPACALFWASAARVAARAGLEREADSLFRHGLSAEMDSAVACREYGLFLRARGRLSPARRYLTRAVQLNPDDARAHRALTELD